MASDAEHLFTRLWAALYVLLGEESVQVLCPFFNCFVFLEWNCVSSIHILEIKHLSKISLASIFSYTVFFLIHLADVFFSHAGAFYFEEVHLFILSFMSLALVDTSVKILLHAKY